MTHHALPISKWLMAALTFVFLVFGSSMAFAQQVKLGFVDLQRALNEVEDGKKAKGKLKKMFDDRQKKLDGQQEELKKFKEQLEGELKSDLISKDKKQEKMADYQKRFYELQTVYMGLQKELTEAEATETKKIFQRFQQILKDIGLKDGYTMIFEKTESSILWAPQSLDITDQLIQRYNTGQ
jgi:outer membrane protein